MVTEIEDEHYVFLENLADHIRDTLSLYNYGAEGFITQGYNRVHVENEKDFTFPAINIGEIMENVTDDPTIKALVSLNFAIVRYIIIGAGANVIDRFDCSKNRTPDSYYIIRIKTKVKLYVSYTMINSASISLEGYTLYEKESVLYEEIPVNVFDTSRFETYEEIKLINSQWVEFSQDIFTEINHKILEIKYANKKVLYDALLSM